MSDHAGYLVFLESWAPTIEHRYVSIEFAKKIPLTVDNIRRQSPVGIKALLVVHSDITVADALHSHLHESHKHGKWYAATDVHHFLDQSECAIRDPEQRCKTYCIGCFFEKHRLGLAYPINNGNQHYSLPTSKTWPEMISALNLGLRENYLPLNTENKNRLVSSEAYQLRVRHNERLGGLHKELKALKDANRALTVKLTGAEAYARALEEKMRLEARNAKALKDQITHLQKERPEDYLAEYLDGLDDL